MNICIHVDPQRSNDIGLARAFSIGLNKHGINPQIIESFYSTECDVAIIFGWTNQTKTIRDRQTADGNLVLSINPGILGDPSKWFSIGYGGKYGHADFCIGDMDAKRRNRYHWELKPWNPGSKRIVIIDRYPADERWLEYLSNKLNFSHGMEIIVHQIDSNHSFKQAKTALAAELIDAAMVITCDDPAAVSSILAGIPTFVENDGSIAWPMAAGIDELTSPITPDREQWLNNLAWCQWTFKEIESGAAWDHLMVGPSQTADDESADE